MYNIFYIFFLFLISFSAFSQKIGAHDLAEDLIKKMYVDWKEMDKVGKFLFHDSIKVKLYFSENVSKKIIQDQEDAAKNREVGSVDFDPISNSQDPLIQNISIRSLRLKIVL